MSTDILENGNTSGAQAELTEPNPPFEGPEKLLEIWFEPPRSTHSENERLGLRTVSREKWEEMLDIVRCKVLNVIHGKELDAYLLSESSLFIYPYKLILKTCGTTLNLLGVPRILEIARDNCSLTTVNKCFYSRKSFMFPERQSGPHRDWKEEVRFLDQLFPDGAAYTVGKMNGDHWLLWFFDNSQHARSATSSPMASINPLTSVGASSPPPPEETSDEPIDYTLEILMSNLSPQSRDHFFFPVAETTDTLVHTNGDHSHSHSHSASTAQARALELSHKLGISTIFPPSLSQLDAYAFEPCGYSANAVISPKNGDSNGGEGYWTIHVTPEEGWSYASFECNVPASASSETSADLPSTFPNLHQLIQRVVTIFQPGNLSLTLFVANATIAHDSPIESAQQVFRKALESKGYKRSDKITYEFSGYDLAFASFKL